MRALLLLTLLAIACGPAARPAATTPPATAPATPPDPYGYVDHVPGESTHRCYLEAAKADCSGCHAVTSGDSAVALALATCGKVVDGKTLGCPLGCCRMCPME